MYRDLRWPYFPADLSWLTGNFINPLNCGQYVNNESPGTNILRSLQFKLSKAKKPNQIFYIFSKIFLVMSSTKNVTFRWIYFPLNIDVTFQIFTIALQSTIRRIFCALWLLLQSKTLKLIRNSYQRIILLYMAD